jgi:hypothetical protein
MLQQTASKDLTVTGLICSRYIVNQRGREKWVLSKFWIGAKSVEHVRSFDPLLGRHCLWRYWKPTALVFLDDCLLAYGPFRAIVKNDIGRPHLSHNAR